MGESGLFPAFLQGKTSIAHKHTLQKKVYSQAQDVNEAKSFDPATLLARLASNKLKDIMNGQKIVNNAGQST